MPPDGNNNVIQFGGLVIDTSSRSTVLDGVSIKLSSNEFELLQFLAANAGAVVSRKDLVTQLRGIEYDGFDRSTDILVSRLRKKLKDNATAPYRIKTVWGKGYLMAKDAW